MRTLAKIALYIAAWSICFIRFCCLDAYSTPPVYWWKTYHVDADKNTPDDNPKCFGKIRNSEWPSYYGSEFYSNWFSMSQDLATYFQANPDSRLIMFVHGCCVDFPQSLKAAVKIANETGYPVLLCSWPAKPFSADALTVFGYHANENAYESTKNEFGLLSSRGASLLPVEKTIVIAHSLGTRMLAEYFDSRGKFGKSEPISFSKKYQITIFANSDVAADQFTDAVLKKRIASNSKQTYILVNDSDPALAVSRRVHDGNRLGAPLKLINSITGQGITIVDQRALAGRTHEINIELVKHLIGLGNGNLKLTPKGTGFFEATTVMK